MKRIIRLIASKYEAINRAIIAFRQLRELATETKNHPLSGWAPKKLNIKKHLFDRTELFKLPSTIEKVFLYGERTKSGTYEVAV